MITSRQHLNIVPGTTEQSAIFQPQVGRGDITMAVIAMALIAVAILLLGAAAGGMVSDTPGMETAQRAAPAPQSSGDFVYFPSQYVNQATEIEEHIQAF
jgi:hypothetical protein